jgi:hypothetical protein
MNTKKESIPSKKDAHLRKRKTELLRKSTNPEVNQT